MSILTSGLWKQAPNTKIPAISHYFSFRIGANTTNLAGGTGFVLNTASTISNFALPANYSNVGQNAVTTGNPAASAPTASAYDPNSEPQYNGAIFVPTMFCVRNPNGTFVAGAATTVTNVLSISLYNPNVASINALTGVVTRTSGSSPALINTLASITWTATASDYQPFSLESVWQANIGTSVSAATVTAITGAGNIAITSGLTTSQGATSVAGGPLTQVKFGLGDSLAVSVNCQSYTTTGSPVAPSATAFTADVFGYWIQGI